MTSRARLVVAAAAFVSALSAAGAQAPTLPYGGGWAGERHHLWLRLEPAVGVDAVARIVGRMETGCGAVTLVARDAPAPGGLLDVRGADGRSTWRLRGALDGTRGRGTVDATVVARGRRCAVTSRPWAVAVDDAPSRVIEPQPGMRFNATTAADGMVAMVVGSDAASLRRVIGSLDMGFCPRRTPDRLWWALRDVPIQRDHSFQRIERFVTRERGLVRRLRVQVSGSFWDPGVRASVSVREVTRRARDGRRVSACDSGAIDLEAAEP